uniref:Uncharacterized protein n=1 Tax=Meloidogyne javanica TaxID=6303 RepID=A0A915MZV3_MELJA
MTVNRRHLRRAIEYQQNNNAIPRYQCPNGCRCVPDNKVNHLLSITCHWPYLKNSRIFNNFPKNGTKSLNIFCEKEEYIEDNILAIDGNFFGFDELRELKINNCRFTQLSAGVFEGLSKLRSLSIIGAKSLHRLEEDFFLRLTKLESLILSDSGLREFPLDGICSLQKLQIESDAFQSGQVPQLQTLDLSSNQLNNLPKILPEGLLHVDMSNNRFQLIPESIVELPGLVGVNLSGNSLNDEIDKILDLSSNKLTSLNIRTFEGLVKLERLLLFNNSIQNIHEEAFQELKNSLEYLNISHNLITKLPAAIGRLSRVETVDLSHNRISWVFI